jgi:hypothetical protein
MAYTKKTRRRMTPRVRKIIDAINDIDRGLKALKRLLPEIAEWETSDQALMNGATPNKKKAAAK